MKEIIFTFLKLGATAYGGPAIIGIMQAELQEKRQWVTKEHFVEGLSLVNMLPGAAATQLGIFLGHARGGMLGGFLAGLCFVVPAFFIMLSLTLIYASFGTTSIMHGALYGMGPVVMGIFLVAVYRLGKTSAATIPQFIMVVAAALSASLSPLGIVQILILAGIVGIFLYYSRKWGAVLLIFSVLLYFVLITVLVPISDISTQNRTSLTPGLLNIGVFFLKVGALSFGGGLSVIAFTQEQVVNQNQWLTQQEFIDGLALGQFTPGPILMVSAYVGYKLEGFAGATVAAMAIFLPAFVLTLSILPIFERARKLRWTKAMMKGIGPGVIGVLSVSIFQMIPHALPDSITLSLFIIAIVALLSKKVGVIKMLMVGAVLGVFVNYLL